ncbi:hypothetical protein D9615_005816 [Tricholomella constricta]|uniref:Integrase core domain-containing protein n=1 Tax=Tricholomella constricta TaxID=117010 RepID=A0A8H5HAI7_9AGAR|nr:hypothetical protein D9615_005816 [Tricholomella constricta]
MTGKDKPRAADGRTSDNDAPERTDEESDVAELPSRNSAAGDSGGKLMHNRNPTGRNQHGAVPPLTEDLKEILRGYNRNNITRYETLRERLADDHGYKIGRSTLAKYLKETGIGSSRKKLIPDIEATQMILDELGNDPRQTRGPRTIKERLALKGQHITRNKIESVMHDFADESFDKRMPVSKQIKRSPLTGIGPDEEWSMDGHDKLRVAGFDIYGIRDKWSGKWHYYKVVPSNWYAAVVGVIQLECIKKVGGMAVQGSTDRGSEVRDAFSIFSALRDHFAPDLLKALVPAWRFLESPKNITIERGWRPLFHTWGVNILQFYYAGIHGAYYEAQNEVHKEMSNWIWFPLIQRELDDFVDTQNNHRIRRQQEKNLPSGGTPNDFYRHPDRYGGQSCLIDIDINVLDQLLDEAVEGRRLMQYVDEEFEEIANTAYIAVGRPKITLHSAWDVFRVLVDYIAVDEN